MKVFKAKAKTGLVLLGLFALTAAGAYFIIPQHVILERDNSVALPDDEGDHVLTGKERFIAHLADSATSGLHLEANELVLTYDGKKEGHANIIDASGTEIAFEMGTLNLHGINLAATLPIDYSDNGNSHHKRGAHVSMIDETLYLNLFSEDDWTYNDKGQRIEMEEPWNFKYKVDLKQHDSSYYNGEDSVVDPVTGGTVYYEYGDLDWLLEDILAILSEGDINVSFEGWLDKLSGDNGSGEEAESSFSSFSTDDLLSSLNDMVETTVDGAPYFIWNLPLGEKTIPLGFRANNDEDYIFHGVDLPAVKNFVEEEGNITIIDPESDEWEIIDGLSLKAKASVGDLSESGKTWAELLVGDKESYQDLRSSRELLEYVAQYVARPQFGLSAELYLGHSEDAVEGTRTKLKSDAVNETLKISLGANADLSGFAFHGFDADLSLEHLQNNQEDVVHTLSVDYFDPSQESMDNAQAFLQIDDILKAKTSKVYLDELYSVLVNDVVEGESKGNDTLSEEAEGESTLDSVLDMLGAVGTAVKGVMDSSLLKAIENGVYVDILDFITSIDTRENQIELVLNLSPLSLNGKVTVLLNGRGSQSDLASITFENIEFASFTLNGEIKTTAFTALGADVELDSYQTLTHLKGIVEQVKGIVDAKSFEANLGVALSKLNDQSVKEEALSVNGNLAFDFGENKVGAVSLDLQQNLTDMLAPNHEIDVQLSNNMKDVALRYGSFSEEHPEGLRGKLSIESFTESLDGVFDDILHIDDRFSRLTASLAKETGGSVLSDLTSGKFFGLLDVNGFVKSIDLGEGGETSAFVLNGSKFGMDEDIVIEIVYAQKPLENEEFNYEGGIKELNVSLAIGENNLTISLDGIQPKQENTSLVLFENTDEFHDLGALSGLVDYAVGTLTLGTQIQTKDEDGSKYMSGISYYGLEGAITVDVGTYTLNVYDFDAYASVEGAETKIYANITDIPVIRGVNAKDNATYFRPHELEGIRDSEVYYYANGIDPKGEALLTRDSSYGRVRNVKDAVRVDGEQFNSNLFGWLGEYTLGICEELLHAEEDTPTEVNPSPLHRNALTRGILGHEALHIEDILTSVSHVVSEDGKRDDYMLSVDLGRLVGINVLGEATIKLSGRHTANYRTLTGLSVHADASAKASNTDSKLHIAAVDIDLHLNNIAEDGTLLNVWEMLKIGDGENARSAFEANFIASCDDDGTIHGGLLYDLWDGFGTGDYSTVYGHDLRGNASAKPGNYYL